MKKKRNTKITLLSCLCLSVRITGWWVFSVAQFLALWGEPWWRRWRGRCTSSWWLRWASNPESDQTISHHTLNKIFTAAHGPVWCFSVWLWDPRWWGSCGSGNTAKENDLFVWLTVIVMVRQTALIINGELKWETSWTQRLSFETHFNMSAQLVLSVFMLLMLCSYNVCIQFMSCFRTVIIWWLL